MVRVSVDAVFDSRKELARGAGGIGGGASAGRVTRSLPALLHPPRDYGVRTHRASRNSAGSSVLRSQLHGLSLRRLIIPRS